MFSVIYIQILKSQTWNIFHCVSITKKSCDNNFHNYNNSIGFKYLPSNYTDYYNNEKNIELVNIIYSEDFKTFNYNFNDFVIYEKNKTNKVIIAKNLISRFLKRKFK